MKQMPPLDKLKKEVVFPSDIGICFQQHYNTGEGVKGTDFYSERERETGFGKPEACETLS